MPMYVGLGLAADPELWTGTGGAVVGAALNGLVAIGAASSLPTWHVDMTGKLKRARPVDAWRSQFGTPWMRC